MKATSQAADFLLKFFDGTTHAIDLRAFPPKSDEKCTGQEFTRDPIKIQTFIERHLNRDNVYFGVLTRKLLEGEKRPKGDAEHCAEIVALWADADFKTTPEKKVAANLAQFPFPPSIIIRSGGGLHLYWLLREPLDSRDPEAALLTPILKGIAAALESDEVSDLPRILRPPGTMNLKYDPPRAVTLERADWDAQYNIGEFAEFASFTPGDAGAALAVTIPKGAVFGDVLRTKLVFKTKSRNGRIVYQYHALTGLNGKPQPCLVQGTVHPDHARYPGECAFIEEGGRFFHTCFDSDCREKARANEEGITRTVLRTLGLEDSLLDPLPVVLLRPGRIPEAVDAAEDILLASVDDVGIFQRGADLVRVVRLAKKCTDGGLERPEGTVMLEPLSTPAILEIFDRRIRFERYKGSRKKEKDKAEDDEKPKGVRVDCPQRVATTYLSRTGAWRLPVLTGVITAPVLRSDGTVLTRPGYDEATGLYLVTAEKWAEIPAEPTREDARQALVNLLAPFAEFPFIVEEDKKEACKAVFAAAILTAIQRRLLRACPLFGISAPAQRTGKSLLAESVAEIATGKPAPATSVSKIPEEFRKVVTSILREGHAVVNLDNITHPLGSPYLATAITQGEYSDRLLGENRNLYLPTNVMWTATGNNLSFRSDLTSRALLCRIDAGVEKPEERPFAIKDLPAYLHENRVRLVTAALTIMKAFHVAGKPGADTLTPWGGFDDWSRNIRAAVIWAGAADPCLTRKEISSDDEELELAGAAITALADAWPDKKPFTVHDAVEKAAEAGSKKLQDALMSVASRKGEINPRSMSWFFRHWRDRYIGERRLRSAGQSKWKIEEVKKETPGDAKEPDETPEITFP